MSLYHSWHYSGGNCTAFSNKALKYPGLLSACPKYPHDLPSKLRSLPLFSPFFSSLPLLSSPRFLLRPRAAWRRVLRFVLSTWRHPNYHRTPCHVGKRPGIRFQKCTSFSNATLPLPFDSQSRHSLCLPSPGQKTSALHIYSVVLLPSTLVFPQPIPWRKRVRVCAATVASAGVANTGAAILFSPERLSTAAVEADLSSGASREFVASRSAKLWNNSERRISGAAKGRRAPHPSAEGKRRGKRRLRCHALR